MWEGLVLLYQNFLFKEKWRGKGERRDKGEECTNSDFNGHHSLIYHLSIKMWSGWAPCGTWKKPINSKVSNVLFLGLKVHFQLGVDKRTQRERAVKVVTMRQRLRARVESLKGQVSDGTRLLWHWFVVAVLSLSQCSLDLVNTVLLAWCCPVIVPI